jgi:hypothetical protein
MAISSMEARKAHDPRHFEPELHRLAADRQRAKRAFLTALGPDFGTAALRAT